MINPLKLHGRLIPILCDILAIPVAWLSAYWLRFNLGGIPEMRLIHAIYLLGPVMAMQIASYWFFGLHRGLWRFSSLRDLGRIIKITLAAALLIFALLYFTPIRLARSILPLYIWLLVSILIGMRCLSRWFHDYHHHSNGGKRVLIVGAGQAAELLLRELAKNSNYTNYQPIALVDDDKLKHGREIHGIRVIGIINEIPKIVAKYRVKLVIIAIPSAKAATIRNIVQLCEQTNVEYRSIPGLNDIVSGRVDVKSLRNIALEDLLGREQVELDWESIRNNISEKKILVSGGGGSIGSELCHQIAHLGCAQLIILDNCEFNLYSIDKELHRTFPNINLVTRLADITDKIALQAVMKKYQPQIIFHAAAYKHVPLLEDHIRMAVRNNVLGTSNIAEIAANNGVETFVLISTDKAVNPVNIMGTTKHIAEIICQNINKQATTNFITVRFGNVLGSKGGVVPLFQKQLEREENITVTHPEISRYFMTISEAAQLILQATAIGKGNEIFVLNMGEPIKIKFLAEQMIFLSGKKLGEEVEIVYTGLRPGEKLNEELFHQQEKLQPTEHEKIMRAKPRVWNHGQLFELINRMEKSCSSVDQVELIKTLQQLAPNLNHSN